jgi:uncharacterized metal-binding protein YceD (DUF177 family)
MKPELVREIHLDTVGSTAQTLQIVATAPECAALAERFDLAEITNLVADTALAATGDGYMFTGTLNATVTQFCVATRLPVPEHVTETFAIKFIAAGSGLESEDLEIDANDCDVMPHDGRVIDIGEAVAQTLGLSLNPWPRAPDADAVLRAAGVLSEDAAGPFAGLRALKDRL